MRRSIMAMTLVVGAVAIALAVFASPFSGVSQVAHESVQFHLNLTASSIYEFHTKTGQWPTRIDDLAKTSLPMTSPHWRYLLEQALIVVVWHQTLKPNPKDNADHILAYYDKGLISERGRKWVCWGDLRTEYIKTEDLQAYLNKLKN